MGYRFWGIPIDEQGGYAPPDARANFPEGWVCKWVPQPQRSQSWRWRHGAFLNDPNWTYVQFPVHYWGMDSEGSWFCLTDQVERGRRGRGKPRGDNGGRVECGMWIPRWLLRPVSAERAQPIYEGLLADYAAALAAAGW